MLSIVYSSRATTPMGSAALSELLAQSRQNNKREDLTGMLLYRSGYFLQVLEGPDESVRTRMALIERDSRHSGIRLLIEEPIGERLFSEWTMGYEQLSGDAADQVPGARTAFDDLAQSPISSATMSAVRALIAWYRRRPN
jgi:hypothetical protein